jgi:hypothetical protein
VKKSMFSAREKTSEQRAHIDPIVMQVKFEILLLWKVKLIIMNE